MARSQFPPAHDVSGLGELLLAPGDEFETKHEFMAMMFGVTRSVVMRAAANLQDEKMIRYTRGQVTILDRRRLEATACECYVVVKAVYADLLP